MSLKKTMLWNHQIESLKLLVKKDKIEIVIDNLIRQINQSDVQNQLILLIAQINENKRNYLNGLKSSEDKSITRNRLRVALLNLIDALEEGNLRTVFDFSIPKIQGTWIDHHTEEDNGKKDIAYLIQERNEVFGFYDCGERRKFSYYIGIIEGQIFKYKWEYFDKKESGFGKMIITQNKLIANWWDEIDDSGFEYERIENEKPDWISLKDIQQLREMKNELIKIKTT